MSTLLTAKRSEGLRISAAGGAASAVARGAPPPPLPEEKGGPANPLWWELAGPVSELELVVDFGGGFGDIVEQVNLLLVEASDVAGAVIGVIEGRAAFLS